MSRPEERSKFEVSSVKQANRAKRSQFRAVRLGPECETNPISGSGPTALGGQLCETKPNLGGLGHVGEGDHRVRDGFTGKWNARNEPNLARLGRARPPASERCETKPISGDAGRDEARGPWDEGQTCETNPIARSGAPRRCPDCGFRIADWGRRAAERLPGGLSPSPCAGQSRKANPISGCPAGTPEAQLRKTKPNLGRMGHLGNSVPEKGRSCKTKPIYPRAPGSGRSAGTGRARRGAIVQNEPNLEGRLCKTNPISTGPAAQTTHLSRIPTAGRRRKSNREKRTQFPQSGGHRGAGLPVGGPPHPVAGGCPVSLVRKGPGG
jgi:hypothetical protein